MTEAKFSIVFDLPESVYTQLMVYCQANKKPVSDVAPQAIASYLRQAEILADQTAKLSA